MAKVKALLYTLSLVLLATLLLSYSIIIYHNTQNYQTLTTELIGLEKLHNLDNSIELSLSTIFKSNSNINTSISNLKVSFEEPLPNPHSDFNTLMDDFKTYIESNTQSLLDTTEIKDKLPIIIWPKNITYQHNPNINIFDKENKIASYTTSITSPDLVICSWTSTEGTLSLRVIATGLDSSCDQTRAVSTATVIINDKVTVELQNNNLTISNTGSTITVKTEINLKETNNQITLRYPQILSINFSKLKITKYSYPRIL